MARIKDDEDEEEQESKPYNISTLSPEGTQDFTPKPVVNQAEIWTSIEQTRLAFQNLGFSVSAYEFVVYGPNGRKLGDNFGAKRFFKRVDISNEPIVQQITTLVRLKAWNYHRTDKGKEKRDVCEFVTYNCTLEGFDRLGNPINASLSKQGICYEPDIRVQITHDEDNREKAVYTFNHLRDKYYIKYEGKKTIDDLLKRTNTNKNNVKYYCYVGSDPSNNTGGIKFRCTGYTYEQFVNSSFEELENLARREGGPNQQIHWKEKKPEKEWVA